MSESNQPQTGQDPTIVEEKGPWPFVTWRVVFANLLGCVAFMLSAPLAISLPGAESLKLVTFSVLCTLIGALQFFTGSLLMLVEEGITTYS